MLYQYAPGSCQRNQAQFPEVRARLEANPLNGPEATSSVRSKFLISEVTGEVLYDRIAHNSLLVRVNSLCYEVYVPSGIASRLRQAPEHERQNPLTLYTIYYIDGGLAGGHLTPKLVGFLDPLDREFFETFTTVPGVGFMRALKCLTRPLNEIALAIERGDTELLKKLPYIGTKTAERIVTDLRGKMAKFALAHSDQPLSVESEPFSDLKMEALQVLEQLEYSRAEAQRIASEILSRHKNLKSIDEFLRKVFEQRQDATGS